MRKHHKQDISYYYRRIATSSYCNQSRYRDSRCHIRTVHTVGRFAGTALTIILVSFSTASAIDVIMSASSSCEGRVWLPDDEAAAAVLPEKDGTIIADGVDYDGGHFSPISLQDSIDSIMYSDVDARAESVSSL